jgi:hypothetical protein
VPTATEHEQVICRALDKRARFHLPKNSVADALLIELYRLALDRMSADRFCFVTANYEDFSAWKGDRRLPHADFADVFDGGAPGTPTASTAFARFLLPTAATSSRSWSRRHT